MTNAAFILTINDMHGERTEAYATRQQAERAMRILTGQGDTVTMREVG